MALLIVNHFEAIFGVVCLALIFTLLSVDTVISAFMRTRLKTLQIKLDSEKELHKKHHRRRRRRVIRRRLLRRQ